MMLTPRSTGYHSSMGCNVFFSSLRIWPWLPWPSRWVQDTLKLFYMHFGMARCLRLEKWFTACVKDNCDLPLVCFLCGCQGGRTGAGRSRDQPAATGYGIVPREQHPGSRGRLHGHHQVSKQRSQVGWSPLYLCVRDRMNLAKTLKHVQNSLFVQVVRHTF